MRSQPKSPRFGQLIIGPPGSGKSTYCRGTVYRVAGGGERFWYSALRAYLRAAGRQCSIVNLDPASEEPINPSILQEENGDDSEDLETTYFDVDVRPVDGFLE